MNSITMKMNADELILSALREDISSEDVTTNAVMRDYVKGEVELGDFINGYRENLLVGTAHIDGYCDL